VDPDLATLVLSPSAFEINIDCVKFFLRTVLATEDPSLQDNECAKSNPLNKGSKRVVNMFECNEKPEILVQNGYLFFLVFHLTKFSERKTAKSVRDAIIKQGLDEKTKFSELFMRDPNIVVEDDSNADFRHMPMPDVDKTDSYVIFAIRKEEVERARAGPPELSADQFAEEVNRISEAEAKKYGALPPATSQAPKTMPPPPGTKPPVDQQPSRPATTPTGAAPDKRPLETTEVDDTVIDPFE